MAGGRRRCSRMPAVTRPNPLTIGIDLGTSGVRIVAIDGAGRVRARTDRRWRPDQSMTPSCWRRDTLTGLGRIIRQVGRHRVRAIAVDGTSGTVLLCASTGCVLSPVLAYNDPRAGREIGPITPGDTETGAIPGTTDGPAKLLWLARHLAPRTAARALTQAAWVTGLLSGDFRVCDDHNALKMGAIDGQWTPGLGAMGLTPLLPRLVAPGTLVGVLHSALVRRYRLRTRPAIVAGTTDSIAGVLALGRLPLGTGITTLGSTLVMKIMSERPVWRPAVGLYSHRLGRRWLVGGASNSGGQVLRHYFTVTELQQLSTHLPLAAPTGLDYYPLVGTGERFPVNDPDWAPRVSPRPADDRQFLQGLLEGMAAIEAQGYRQLRMAGAPPLRQVITLGGGASNHAWRQIRATHLGVPVSAPRKRSAAYGTARLAAAAVDVQQRRYRRCTFRPTDRVRPQRRNNLHRGPIMI